MLAESLGIGTEQVAGSISINAAFNVSQEMASGRIVDGLATLLDKGQIAFDKSSLRVHGSVCST